MVINDYFEEEKKHFYTPDYWLLLKINNKYALDTALETAT